MGSSAEKPKKLHKTRVEEVTVSEDVFGDLSVQHSKRTGQATGHTTTVVEGAKRIEWVREHAKTNHITPSKVVRNLVNDAIDRRIRVKN